MNKISIIVPVYNSEKYIETCIKSLINQTYKEIEIILVNDGSTDESLKICERFENIDKRIKIYNKKNEGVSSARNLGIEQANGKYLCFVDSDDTVDIDFCETLIKNLENENADLSCCGCRVIKNNKQEKDKQEIKKLKYALENKYIELLKRYKGFLCNKLYKKEILDANNLRLNEDISMCEDLLFNFQYLDKCGKIVGTNEKKYNYIVSDVGLSKGLSKTWFDILYVYNYLYKNIEKYDKNTQDNIILEFMYAISETRMRAKIMGLEEAEILKKYSIAWNNIYMKNYKRILHSKYILLQEKIKLIIFIKFEWFARYIKFGRL